MEKKQRSDHNTEEIKQNYRKLINHHEKNGESIEIKKNKENMWMHKIEDKLKS